MEPQHLIIGACGSLVMGLTLGVFGAGGSILTVPLLVFLLGYPPLLATHYSLFIVGAVSAAGVAWQLPGGKLKVRKTLVFALPAMAGMFLIKRFLLPALPSEISVSAFSFTLDQFIMIVFAAFMILAAGSMIFVKIVDEKHGPRDESAEIALLGIAGVLTGAISGFVGAGGGFLIVPALVFLGSLSLKDATRASLFIIALNSLWGFVAGTQFWTQIPFTPLLLIIAFALLGMVLGLWIQERVPAKRLKPAFGLFILFMGIYILIRSWHR